MIQTFLHECAESIKGASPEFSQQGRLPQEQRFFNEVLSLQREQAQLRDGFRRRLGGLRSAGAVAHDIPDALKGFSTWDDKAKGLLGQMREVAQTMPGGEAGMMQRLRVAPQTTDERLAFPINSIDALERLLRLQGTICRSDYATCLGVHTHALFENSTGGSEKSTLRRLSQELIVISQHAALDLAREDYALPTQCYQTMVLFDPGRKLQESTQQLKEGVAARYVRLYPELTEGHAQSMVEVNHALAQMARDTNKAGEKDLTRIRERQGSVVAKLCPLSSMQDRFIQGFVKVADVAASVSVATASALNVQLKLDDWNVYGNRRDKPLIKDTTVFLGAKEAYLDARAAFTSAAEISREHMDAVSRDSGAMVPEEQIDTLILNFASVYRGFNELLHSRDVERRSHPLSQDQRAAAAYYGYDSLRCLSHLLAKHCQLGLGDRIGLPVLSMPLLTEALDLERVDGQYTVEQVADAVNVQMRRFEERYRETPGVLAQLPHASSSQVVDLGQQQQAQRALDSLLADLAREDAAAEAAIAQEEVRAQQATEERRREIEEHNRRLQVEERLEPWEGLDILDRLKQAEKLFKTGRVAESRDVLGGLRADYDAQYADGQLTFDGFLERLSQDTWSGLPSPLFRKLSAASCDARFAYALSASLGAGLNVIGDDGQVHWGLLGRLPQEQQERVKEASYQCALSKLSGPAIRRNYNGAEAILGGLLAHAGEDEHLLKAKVNLGLSDVFRLQGEEHVTKAVTRAEVKTHTDFLRKALEHSGHALEEGRLVLGANQGIQLAQDVVLGAQMESDATKKALQDIEFRVQKQLDKAETGRALAMARMGAAWFSNPRTEDGSLSHEATKRKQLQDCKKVVTTNNGLTKRLLDQQAEAIAALPAPLRLETYREQQQAIRDGQATGSGRVLSLTGAVTASSGDHWQRHVGFDRDKFVEAGAERIRAAEREQGTALGLESAPLLRRSVSR